MSNAEELGPKVRVIGSEHLWIEGEAIRQLRATADLPGMRLAVAMPDIHPGRGSPNGAAFLADEIYPALVGNDDGCGMALWATTILSRKAKIDKMISRLQGLDQPWDGDVKQWLADREIEPTDYDLSLGTPGFGNHFIEIQEVAQIIDPQRFAELGMLEDRLHITVHSGSRGFGESIMWDYASRHGANGVKADEPAGREYLKQNAHAMAWAVANRELCAHRTLEALGGAGTRLLDICHNSVTEAIVAGCPCWLHRKGAAPADKGAVVIPGSRGDLSFVVQPTDSDKALSSLAHGAGRKISRSDSYGKLAKLYAGKDLRNTKFGGRVICGDRNLLWEEAPECYKDISTVVGELVQAGLATVIATLRPMLTFKTSETVEAVIRQDRKKIQRDRDHARSLKHRQHN